ncbi:MAG: HlyD family secretion protein [Acetobacteraceae bacterium]|nr:HlyD family secretion protein [Acetobacteraceae bacterium]
MSQATATDSPRVGEHAAGASSRRRDLRRILRPVLMLGGIGLVIAGSLVFWISGGRVVSIDNAYVRAAKEALSTDVAGIVMEVPVREGQQVNKGEVLLRLDPKPFELAVLGARANLGGVTSGLNAMKVEYKRMLSDVQVKQSQVALDQVNTDRLAGLVKSGGVTRAEYDNARYQLATNLQAVEALKLAAAVQLARLGGDPEVDVHIMSDYIQAKARLDEARRQLDHTVIYAPFAGVVTQVETVQQGMYLAAAAAAFGLVSTERTWIEANPKETELTHVKVGNPVSVTIDTYPGRRWNCTVESIAPNSGSEFSILPAQNTSGNWVKVVQRIPVRVKCDRHADDPAFRAGMSVIADIDTGHRRTWRELF